MSSDVMIDSEKSKKNIASLPIVLQVTHLNAAHADADRTKLAVSLSKWRKSFPSTPIVLAVPSTGSSRESISEMYFGLDCRVVASNDSVPVAGIPVQLDSLCPDSEEATNLETQTVLDRAARLLLQSSLYDQFSADIQGACGVINLINSQLAAEPSSKHEVADASIDLYRRIDALAVKSQNSVRARRQILFAGSAVLCVLLSIGAFVSKLPAVLMTLPLVVFWLLKISARQRRSQSWKVALYARAFAEMLRIRRALLSIGCTTDQLIGCYPRQGRHRFLPVVLAAAGMDALDEKLGFGETPSKDAFNLWVDEQDGYYGNAIKREDAVAKSGTLTFDLAFTFLTLVATVAILYSILKPILWPGLLADSISLLASCIGACLSSLGLIAINYVRETGARNTAQDYRHMRSVFSDARERTSGAESNLNTMGLELAEEALAEHSAWFARMDA